MAPPAPGPERPVSSDGGGVIGAGSHFAPVGGCSDLDGAVLVDRGAIAELPVDVGAPAPERPVDLGGDGVKEVASHGAPVGGRSDLDGAVLVNRGAVT